MRVMTWHIMEHVSLPLPALLWPLLALTALATESHRDLKIFTIEKYILSLDLHNDADLDAGGVHQGGVKELGGAARLVLSPTLCGPGARAVLHKGSDERLD